MSASENGGLLGIIGGVGPLASAYFADLLIRKTQASSDGEHLPFLLYSDSRIPDRTAYILGKSTESPLPEMKHALKVLESAGCTLIALTCNTAHYFYGELCSASSVPVINMPREAVISAVKRAGSVKKIGVMATDGTISSGIYEKIIRSMGYEYAVPDAEGRKKTMEIIYSQVKAGKSADMNAFNSVVNGLLSAGCDSVILGCTELSVINADNRLTEKYPYITDAMECLAEKCIELCGYKVK